jgi:SAM-dependent methyltransferase
MNAPLPPLALREITASSDETIFLSSGLADLGRFLDLYRERGASLRNPPWVLDYGCGCGRLSRHLDGDERFVTFGCDLNPDHVAWCQQHLRGVRTVLNRPGTALPFPGGFFDLVYGLSVVTHLSEEVALGVVADIARVLRPGGVAILTVHGYPALATIATSAVHQDMTTVCRARALEFASSLPARGYIYVPYPPEIVRLANVGEIDYGVSFVDPAHAERAWGLFAYAVHAEFNGWQDAIVLRRKA